VTDLGCAVGGFFGRSQLVERLGVDRNWIRPGQHLPPIRHPDPIPLRFQSEPVSNQPDEVLGAAGKLKTDEISAQESFQDLLPPWKLDVKLGRGERDVEKETNP
jgi:hypothetical protein